ncbi:hypothetical protein Tco_1262939 [Tanacetum coccineum]
MINGSMIRFPTSRPEEVPHGIAAYCHSVAPIMEKITRQCQIKVSFEESDPIREYVKNIDLLSVIEDEERFTKMSDEDSIRVCLLLSLEVIFVGCELGSAVDDVFLRMVDNLKAWNDFPWGEHIWRELYAAIRNVNSKHKDEHHKALEKNQRVVPSYLLSGFLLCLRPIRRIHQGRYGVSVPALTKTTKERRSICRIQRKSIRRIKDIVCEYSGRYQTWSLLQETPIRRIQSLGYAVVHDKEFKKRKCSEEEVAETMAETMEQYMSKTQADYGSGVTRPKIENKDNIKLKGHFLKELRTNTFSGSDHEDANEHIEKVLEIEVIFIYNGLGIPTRQILDSRGAIPSKTTADAKISI